MEQATSHNFSTSFTLKSLKSHLLSILSCYKTVLINTSATGVCVGLGGGVGGVERERERERELENFNTQG